MPTVVDTVILHYFLLAEEFNLLLDILDPPVVVPRIVFDPDESDGSEAALSELTRNVRYEQRLAHAPSTSETDRERTKANIARLPQMREYVKRGDVEVVDMTPAELSTFARLTADAPDASLQLLAPLGAGEAACVAIAIERSYTLATDDTDALRVLNQLRPDHPYERTRRLLVRAATESRISRGEANETHRRLRELGFWDRLAPFPPDDEP